MVTPSPSIDQFYKYVGQRKLMAVRCRRCRKILLPPREFCPRCHSQNVYWIRLRGRGRIETFTIVHVGPPEFADKVPYVLGLVKLEEGVRIPTMIETKNIGLVKIGDPVLVDFDTKLHNSWPTWARYFFRPVAAKSSRGK